MRGRGAHLSSSKQLILADKKSVNFLLRTEKKSTLKYIYFIKQLLAIMLQWWRINFLFLQIIAEV